MKKVRFLFLSAISLCSIAMLVSCGNSKKEAEVKKEQKDTVKTVQYYDIKKGEKPSSAQIIEMLKQGNERFANGKTTHPHADLMRIKLADSENQGDYAIASILSCSDSRVPVEMLFDAGIMDLFVIRVAGNVADADEIGSIEYGVGHVKTPVLIVLGHSKCGAVTAVTHAIEGNGHEMEYNIPALVDNIIPAAKKVMESHKGSSEEEIISLAIEENVWQSAHDILMKSAAVREKIKAGTLKIVGAIYTLESGKINWLSDKKMDEVIQMVERNPKKNNKALAEK